MSEGKFKPVLGLWDATMVVAGSMIGSGIFIVSADIVVQRRQLQAFEHAFGEMQLGIREFAWRVAFVVRNDLDDHDGTS